jgi:hypothetical protein
LDGGAYDLIVAADVLWLTEQHDNLLYCLKRHLRQSPASSVFLVCGLHTGRAVIRRFLGAAISAGFEIRLCRENRFIPFRDGEVATREWVEVRESETNADRSFWTVEVILGFAGRSVDNETTEKYQ